MKTYQSKREVIEDFLDNGLIMVHVDSRRPCSVPLEHVGNPALRLNLSRRFEGADIVITDDGIQATLTFGGVPTRITLPWGCVYAVTSKTMNPPAAVFADDVPAEVKVAVRTAEGDHSVDAESIRAELRKIYAELPTEELECHRLAIADVIIDCVNKPVSAKLLPPPRAPSSPEALQNLVSNLAAGSYDPAPTPGTRRFTVIKGGKPD